MAPLRFLVALWLFALAHCGEPNWSHTAERSAILGKDGARYVWTGYDGSQALLVYIPLRVEEPEPAPDVLASLGYNTLTLKTPPAPDTVGAFFAHVRGRSEKHRILMIHGGLADTLPAAVPDPNDGFSGLILLRPGDITPNNRVLRGRLREFASKRAVVWLNSRDAPEQRSALVVTRGIPAEAPGGFHQFIHSSLDSEQLADFNPTAALIERTGLATYFLLSRMVVEWRGAATVFPRGCFLGKSAGRSVAPTEIEVSARAQPDMCPLFVRRKPSIVLRALEARRDGCRYDQDLLCPF